MSAVWRRAGQLQTRGVPFCAAMRQARRELDPEYRAKEMYGDWTAGLGLGFDGSRGTDRTVFVRHVPPALDDEEREAMDSIGQAMRLILRWGLGSNRAELTAAIHVLQGFVVQHMLHRLAPAEWNDWYHDAAG